MADNSNSENKSSSEIRKEFDCHANALKSYMRVLEDEGRVSDEIFSTLKKLTSLCDALSGNKKFVESQGSMSLVVTSTLSGIKKNSRYLKENVRAFMTERITTRSSMSGQESRISTGLYTLILDINRLLSNIQLK